MALQFRGTPAGKQIANGVKLRILPVGDSITVGFLSDVGGDGDGYRRQLRNDLFRNRVVFAGTESSGTMDDGYYAAWSGKTIQYMADHINPSLEQRPNVVLIGAGTNDMNSNPSISTEGIDPVEAASRLGKLIDKITDKCPDAVVLVAMIIDTCDPSQEPRTQQYQKLVPGIAKTRRDAGHHVLAANFTTFVPSYGDGVLRDCIHPTNEGYKLFGDYCPLDSKPEGSYRELRDWAVGDGPARCNSNPAWKATGKIAASFGRNGDWKFHKDWQEAGKVVSGFGLDGARVRLHDMNGDGEADYVWIDPVTGEIRCWLNNLPNPWTPAGNNDSIIGSGAGRGQTIYLAVCHDMNYKHNQLPPLVTGLAQDKNGDAMDDYLVVNPRNGAVRIFWNRGPDESWANGWKFVDGGVIASGVPHANLATLRFPDINGDGRTDYVYVGKSGSVVHFLNVGSVGGTDVVFHDQKGIATGVGLDDLPKLVFADTNGDGRDEYLVWDGDGGLSGLLNQRTNREGVPLFIDQGGAKSISDGIGQAHRIRLADMDGDGKDDYVVIGDNGALSVWYTRGTTDDSMAIDGLRFADITGSLGQDYVWVDPKTGAPTVYDGCDDYLVLEPETGALTAYLLVPGGGGKSQNGSYSFTPIGQVTSGPGLGKNVRIADIDGDGTTIYRNMYGTNTTSPDSRFAALPQADAAGIGQRPKETSFHDINGYVFSFPSQRSSPATTPHPALTHIPGSDGRADYVWTRPLNGRVEVWLNMYPQQPAWRHVGVVNNCVGTSGANTRLATLPGTRRRPGSGRADFVAVGPNTGALAAWLNGCDDGT
ncbi:lipolytic protein G-D-S-L family [Cordyceps fumosorosea ARSEF 2679]|uniref:Lipolytic protein G-D-S-L family n=1 Tax=Cordyceps fumosorosea (strain ARSEF 2679) TaxID=1081104 RepID=A0A168DC57_CORFA|nr:lipolytic protein G-D-S-L family [Cordyceps fumosorosea ARSEF 2679]OAA72425.1 lipolytic protein G-D-S-L family [Cordyceps fumosorosea ARSEF 2679]